MYVHLFKLLIILHCINKLNLSHQFPLEEWYANTNTFHNFLNVFLLYIVLLVSQHLKRNYFYVLENIKVTCTIKI